LAGECQEDGVYRGKALANNLTTKTVRHKVRIEELVVGIQNVETQNFASLLSVN